MNGALSKWLVVFCGLLLAFVRIAAGGQRGVDVAVVVRCDGVPMTGVPLAIFIKEPRQGVASLVTDDSGRAAWRAEVGDGGAVGMVAVAMPTPQYGETAEAFHARWTWFQELLQRYTFEEYYPFQIAAGEASVLVEIDVVNAVRASVRFITPLEKADQKIAVWGEMTSRFATSTDANGVTVVGGLPPGRQNFMYVMCGGTVSRVTVPPAAADTDLGAVELPVTRPAGRISVELRDRAACERFHERPITGVTLVSGTTGQAVTVGGANADGPMHTYRGELPTAPAGTYWVAPFLFTGRPAQLRLIDRVKAGEDLENSGIPRIVVPEGGTGTVVVDCAAAEAAILGTGKKD